jgi:murein DD-endopeptidase MepM/ murein hydrolase activator NlpD
MLSLLGKLLMVKLDLGETIIKVIAVAAISILAILSWQFAETTLKDNRSDIAVSLQAISNRIALPFQITRLSQQPETKQLPVPIYGVSLEEINDTWGAARAEGRTHEGVDIFAEQGTPVFSATRGYVTELNIGDRGGTNIMIIGPGGLYYYYAHLSRIANGIEPGTYVTQDTVLGFVGNSGNASGTPPHLHFGIYPEMWEAVNPYPQLIDRWQ